MSFKLSNKDKHARQEMPTLIFLLLILTANSSSIGIIPTTVSDNFKPFTAEYFKFSPSQEINQTTFLGNQATYTLKRTLSQTFYIGKSSIITTSFDAASNYSIGYKIKQFYKDNPSTDIYINFTVIGTSSFKMIGLTVILITPNFEPYMQFTDVQLLEGLNYQPFTAKTDFDDTVFSVWLKSMTAVWNGPDDIFNQQQLGFQTLQFHSSPHFYVAYQKQPFDNQAQIKVTYTLIQVKNDKILSQTAQFSNLQFKYINEIFLSEKIQYSPSYYNHSRRNDIIFGILNNPYQNTIQPKYDVILNQTHIVYQNNNLMGNFFQYSAMVFTDKSCPSTHPYRKNGDKLCYDTCEQDKMEIINLDKNWNQTSSIIKSLKCAQIDLTAGYMLIVDQNMGLVTRICAKCKRCNAGFFMSSFGICSAKLLESKIHIN